MSGKSRAEKSGLLDDDALEKLAMQEILKETKRNADRAKEMGSLGWQKPGIPSTNKRFLSNMLVSTLRNPLQSRRRRRSRSRDSDSDDGRSQSKRRSRDSDSDSRDRRKHSRDHDRSDDDRDFDIRDKHRSKHNGEFRHFRDDHKRRGHYKGHGQGQYRGQGHRQFSRKECYPKTNFEGIPGENMDDFNHLEYMQYMENYKLHMEFYDQMESKMEESNFNQLDNDFSSDISSSSDKSFSHKKHKKHKHKEKKKEGEESINDKKKLNDSESFPDKNKKERTSENHKASKKKQKKSKREKHSEGKDNKDKNNSTYTSEKDMSKGRDTDLHETEERDDVEIQDQPCASSSYGVREEMGKRCWRYEKSQSSVKINASGQSSVSGTKSTGSESAENQITENRGQLGENGSTSSKKLGKSTKRRNMEVYKHCNEAFSKRCKKSTQHSERKDEKNEKETESDQAETQSLSEGEIIDDDNGEEGRREKVDIRKHKRSKHKKHKHKKHKRKK